MGCEIVRILPKLDQGRTLKFLSKNRETGNHAKSNGPCGGVDRLYMKRKKRWRKKESLALYQLCHKRTTQGREMK